MEDLYKAYSKAAGIKPENICMKVNRYKDSKSREAAAERLVRDWESPYPQPDITPSNT